MIRPAFYSDPLVWSDLISWVFSAFQTFFSSPSPPLLSIWCSKSDSNDLTSYLDSSRTHFSHHNHNIKCNEKYQLQLRVCQNIVLSCWLERCRLWDFVYWGCGYDCVFSCGKLFHSKVVGILYCRLYARIGFLLHLLRLLRFYWNIAKSESQVTLFLFKYSKKWKSGYSVYSV